MLDIGQRQFRQRRRQQEAVAIRSVHRETVLVDRNAWKVVRESRTQAGAEFDDARLGERRMDSVGGPQQFQRRAHADAGVLGLDRGGAQHKQVVLARDHIKWPARMDQADRARELDLAGFDQDQFALHAAQLWLFVARAEAPTVDHDALNSIAIGRAKFTVELDGAARRDNALVQLWQHAARLDMAFAGKEQRVTEAALE